MYLKDVCTFNKQRVTLQQSLNIKGWMAYLRQQLKPNIYSKPTTIAQRSRFWVLWYVVQQPSGAITTTTSTGGISNIVEQQQQQQRRCQVGWGRVSALVNVMAG